MRRVPTRAIALIAATMTLFGASVALAPAALAATDVTVTATPSAVTVGDTVSITVAADAGADLFAYDLTVGYDADLLSYVAGSAVYPAGGFGAVTEDTGSVSFTNTRLGTSPGLTGAQQLVTFSFTAIADGTVTVALSGATFIDSTNATTTLPAPVTTTVGIAPVVVESPSPSPSASTTTAPTSNDPDSTSGSASGALATTGADAAPWIIVGAAALVIVAIGAVLVVRRRKEATR